MAPMTHRVRTIGALALALACAACGAGDDDGGAADAAAAVDAEPDCPALAVPAPTWLDDYLAGVVAALSGAAEVSPGVTLDDRASTGNRAAARAFLADELEALGIDSQLQDYGGGVNVWGEIVADTTVTQTVVIGAHFDTVANAPGADDNATGVAAVLAAARYLTEVDCRQRHVLVAFFDQEEIGLVGSTAFAEDLVVQPRAVTSVHTVDQLGWDDDGDGAIELEKPGPGLDDVYQAAAAAGGFDGPLVVTATETSDHDSFRQLGMKAVGVSEEFVGGDTSPFIHSPNDSFETLDLDYLSESTRFFIYVIARQVSF